MSQVEKHSAAIKEPNTLFEETAFDKSMRLLAEMGKKIDWMNADTERRLTALEVRFGLRK